MHQIKNIQQNNDLSFLNNILNKYLDVNNTNLVIKNLSLPRVHSFIINPNILLDRKDLDIINNLNISDIDDLVYFYDDIISKNILSFCGAYYMMDSSSSIISYYLKDLIKDNGLVIDLCSAPGGKSISLALRRKDLLFICNDLSYSRAYEITKNVNRLQINNILIMSSNINDINLENKCDLVIVDVPCSGLGMIRKNLDILKDYSIEKVNRLIPIQESILEKAYNLVSSGGIISYSTCSLNIEENEYQIKKILNKHKDLKEVKIDVDNTIIKGEYGYHLLPGIFKGEGIYFCFLQKVGVNLNKHQEIKLNKELNLNSFKYKNNSYYVSKIYDSINKLNYISPGIKIFDTNKYAKTKYTHEFILISDNYNHINLDYDSALKYISGNEIKYEGNELDDLYIACYNNYKLGLVNKKGNKLKCILPRGIKIN